MKQPVRDALQVVFALLLLYGNAAAQIVFDKRYGSSPYPPEKGIRALQTWDGGYIVLGETSVNGNGGLDLLLMKTDPYGNVLWRRTYGGPENEFAADIEQTYDGGYIIVGSTSSYGEKILVVKTEADGDTIWTRTIGGVGRTFGYAITQGVGEYLVTGHVDTSGWSAYGNTLLASLDYNGNMKWAKVYPGARNGGRDVTATQDNGYLILGWKADDLFSGGSLYLIKTNNAGDTAWTRTYEGVYGFSLRNTSDGNYIIAGVADDSVSGKDSVYLLKIDNDGKKVWSKSYGGSAADIAHDIKETSDGGFVITGISENFGGTARMYALRTNAVGDSLWTFVYGKKYGRTEGRSVEQTQDGGYILCGTADSLIYLVKTNANGDSPAELNENGMFPRLDIYPNPVIGSFRITNNGQCMINVEVRFYAVSGKLVRKDTKLSGTYIELSRKDLPAGVYIVEVAAEGEIAGRQKVILE